MLQRHYCRKRRCNRVNLQTPFRGSGLIATALLEGVAHGEEPAARPTGLTFSFSNVMVRSARCALRAR